MKIFNLSALCLQGILSIIDHSALSSSLPGGSPRTINRYFPCLEPRRARRRARSRARLDNGRVSVSIREYEEAGRELVTGPASPLNS